MDYVNLGSSTLSTSRLIYGCMRIVGDGSQKGREQGKQALRAAIEAGYTHFDHADIYGAGECEVLFREILREMPSIRDSLVITSKCGIRIGEEGGAPKRYDFSKSYIINSVEESLSRLGVDHLDVLLLHRPDYLFDAKEVVAAFEELHSAGKVQHFGVSNFSPSQVDLLQTYCSFPLVANQVEINIDNISTLLDGTLDQCQRLQISPQAWCPLGGVVYPAWGRTLSAEDEGRIQQTLSLQGKKYGVENWVVILAWLLRHPAKILPIVGSTKPARIQMAKKALTIDYSREDWYTLLEARNGVEVP